MFSQSQLSATFHENLLIDVLKKMLSEKKVKRVNKMVQSVLKTSEHQSVYCVMVTLSTYSLVPRKKVVLMVCVKRLLNAKFGHLMESLVNGPTVYEKTESYGSLLVPPSSL